MTPKRLVIAPLRGGARRITLTCSCVSAGRLFAPWEPDDEAIARLLEDHRRKAPACRHPDPIEARR
jgi:hypothetical protein